MRTFEFFRTLSSASQKHFCYCSRLRCWLWFKLRLRRFFRIQRGDVHVRIVLSVGNQWNDFVAQQLYVLFLTYAERSRYCNGAVVCEKIAVFLQGFREHKHLDGRRIVLYRDESHLLAAFCGFVGSLCHAAYYNNAGFIGILAGFVGADGNVALFFTLVRCIVAE